MKEDAPAVARLREAGAVILGKTTLQNSAGSADSFPAQRQHAQSVEARPHPVALSGGAAAAALLNLGHLHIGTDGAARSDSGGLHRRVRIKPSYGALPPPGSPFSILGACGPLTVVGTRR